MKKLIFLLFFNFATYSQDNNGYIVEYNMPISVEFQVYETPLRINKVESQNQINYSSISGLLQSYLSANNIDWAMSEYIDKQEKIVRDNEHFDAVKKSTVNDYIQLETAYTFNYQNRKFAIVKYSLIFEKLPFPWTSLMILENENNHWYISKILNQNQVLLFLGNSSNDFIINCLSGNMIDSNSKEIIEKSKINGIVSMSKLSLELNLFDERLKKKFYDSRITNDKAEFRNGVQNSISKEYKFNLHHPFLIKSFKILEYQITDKNIIKNEKNVNSYQDKPEILLLDEKTPTDFLSKITIDFGDKSYYLIKYRKNNKDAVMVVEYINNQFNITENSKIKEMENIFLEYKLSFLKELIENPKQDFLGSSGGVNINELISYILKNKATLSKYLDE